MWMLLRVMGFSGALRLIIRLMLDRRVPLRLKLVLPAAIAYIISPIDLVPDILPALGRIDDIVVALLALAIFLGLAPRDVVMEHIRGPGRGSAGDEDSGGAHRSKAKVIEGSYRIEDNEQEPGRQRDTN